MSEPVWSAENPCDAYAPSWIAARVEEVGVAEARLAFLPTLTLAVLAGAFIAFGALGFEHSVANMYLIPVAILTAGAEPVAGLDLAGFVHNLVFGSAGNIIGGAGLVALVYWIAYLRRSG